MTKKQGGNSFADGLFWNRSEFQLKLSTRHLVKDILWIIMKEELDKQLYFFSISYMITDFFQSGIAF